MNRPRTGIFATVDGVEYPANSYPEGGAVTLVVRAQANPNPDLFGRDTEHDVWAATVPTDRCERIVEITSIANYQGHTCQVIAIDPDGSVGLHYVGTEQAAVVRHGFVQVDQGTWARTVAVHEITQYRERHTDLMFDEWKGRQPE
ncbi:MAG TPA: hypothetical protein VFV67_21700 [Actinophytocola sp.]|uniref:hypothetical protein n=1 Tax=Actinophytocola sp. TaxID=1872138 RepID=UPI002DBECC52|nr:hypothetical protein [Actinophytocola sp.]HEU5473268.1 hypothetical protein [Actinophytocola sp.]